MKDSELNKQKRRFEKMITDKKVLKVEKKENKFFIYFKEGSVVFLNVPVFYQRIMV